MIPNTRDCQAELIRIHQLADRELLGFFLKLKFQKRSALVPDVWE